MKVKDEWTLVSHGKTAKRNYRERRKGCGQTGDGGLYSASVDGAARKQRAGCEHEYGRDQIEGDVVAVLRALEQQLHSERGFSFNLLASIATASSCTEMRDGGVPHDESTATLPLLREIVAYGIGNFATGRFKAPMLQLAYLLLIRRRAVGRRSLPTAANTFGGKSLNKDALLRLFEIEQRHVPIFYYEPNMLPVEKLLLETVFRVQVLESNELGKRTVESMQQQQQKHKEVTVSLNTTTTDATTTDSTFNRYHTLFYMPHCPMRLYCNVLQAHWECIFPLGNSKKDNVPIIIFGNSFLAYDERAISSEERKDPTNGVLSVSSFTREIPVGIDTHSGDLSVDVLRHLGTAFNDCSTMYFPAQFCKHAPEQPKEWIPSNDPDRNGELI